MARAASGRPRDRLGHRQRLSINETIVDLGALESVEIVEGDLTVVGNLVLEELSLPALVFAGRRLLENDGERVRGGVFIQGNPVLTDISLPALTDVGACFVVESNAELDSEIVDALFRLARTPFPAPVSPTTSRRTRATQVLEPRSL